MFTRKITTSLKSLICCLIAIMCDAPGKLHADSRSFYYKSNLSLILVTKGTFEFLEKCKELPDKDYKRAIQEVIELKDCNNTNVPQLFNALSTTLKSRIDRIEKVRGKSIYWDDIIFGSKIMLACAAITYGLYRIYTDWYCSNSNEYNAIKAAFIKRGGTVSEWATEIRVRVPYTLSDDHEKCNRLLALYKKCENIGWGIFIGSLFTAQGYFYSIGGILSGLRPHYDDKYLEKYQALLAITEDFMKEFVVASHCT